MRASTTNRSIIIVSSRCRTYLPALVVCHFVLLRSLLRDSLKISKASFSVNTRISTGLSGFSGPPIPSQLMSRQPFIYGCLYLGDPSKVARLPLRILSRVIETELSINRATTAPATAAGDREDRRQRVNVSFSSREKHNACRRAHRLGARANYIITKFP